MTEEEVSLRPMVSLRPGGGSANPFAGFGKGAGFGIRVTKAAATDEAPRKRTGEIVRYSKEFLLKFMERYNKCPIELQQLQSEIVLTEDDPERDAVRQNLQRMAEDVDDKDNWRTRTPLPAAPQNNNNNNNNRNPRAAPTPAADLPKLQKAEELGRQAYRAGAISFEGTEKAMKQVKGILNKLTPEKFERLLAQLLDAVATAEILQHAITMVFENAVAQPTFCALYAELCLQLSKALPEFPPKEGEDKALTFKRVLLNTCQDEFEAAAGAREELKSMGKGDERELAERKVKVRTLGNVRLISELYKKNVVNEKIMHVCIREMLATPDAKTLPPEDNIEAVCEMITTAGKQLASASGTAPAKGSSKNQVDALSGYLARLERIASNGALASRLRFLIRDVLDLKKSNWNPRRETYTAKKLDEVRAQAEAELGLIPSKLAAKLPVLPALQQAQQQDEMDLLPPLRDADGWETVGKKGAAFSKGSSALLGDYKPPERPAAPAPSAPAPVAAPSAPAPAPAKPSKPLTAEEFTNKCQSLYREYLSVRDVKEAVTCVRELRAAPSAVPEAERGAAAVTSGMDELLNAVKDADQDALVALLVAMHKEGAVVAADVQGALKDKVSALEDLSLDVPLAPKLLGKLLAATVGAGIVSLAALPEMLEPVESADPRRAFLAAGLRALKSLKGEDALRKLATDAKMAAAELLKSDPEFDGDLPAPAEWLREQGLSCIPL